MSDDVQQLQVDELTQRCADETAKFNRQVVSDTQFCFELFRRALVDSLPEAIAGIFRIYEPLALRWTYAHKLFSQTGESAEYFSSLAVRTLYLQLRGPKFAQFSTLNAILAYLKRCVYTSVTLYVRDYGVNPIPFPEHVEPADPTDQTSEAGAEELWNYLCTLLPDEHDRLLARCVFVLDLKPRQLVTLYPSIWQSEREISVALYRIRRVLRNDKQLQQWSL
jgi:hypothetical protein